MRRNFKNMLDSLVKIDNTLVWDGHTYPFHEAYYLIINDPKTTWSLWIRYTLCNVSPTKSSNSHHNVASLWATYIDKQGTKIAVKNNFELSKHDIVHTDQFISIGGSFLSLAESVGSVQKGKDCIKWEINFEDPVTSLRIFPNSLFYHLSRPKTKFVQPRLVSHATGQFYVNHRRKEVNRCRVHQAHSYGTGLSHGWAWANCIHFKEDSQAYFEALSLKTGFGKRLRKSLNLFCLCMDGKKYYANTLTKMFFNKSKYDFDSWHMEFTKSGFKFVCVVRRDPRLTAGLLLDGPNGEKKYSYLSMLASIEIKVYKYHKGSWQYYKTLSSTENCSFETVTSKKNEALTLNLE